MLGVVAFLTVTGASGGNANAQVQACPRGSFTELDSGLELYRAMPLPPYTLVPSSVFITETIPEDTVPVIDVTGGNVTVTAIRSPGQSLRLVMIAMSFSLQNLSNGSTCTVGPFTFPLQEIQIPAPSPARLFVDLASCTGLSPTFLVSFFPANDNPTDYFVLQQSSYGGRWFEIYRGPPTCLPVTAPSGTSFRVRGVTGSQVSDWRYATGYATCSRQQPR